MQIEIEMKVQMEMKMEPVCLSWLFRYFELKHKTQRQ
jgi:hypothetical protein